MRCFVAPDVNGPRHYHPSNESILEGDSHTFRHIFRDIEFTALSDERACTSGRFGVQSRQGPRLQVGHIAETSTRRMAEGGHAGRGWAVWGGGEIANAFLRAAGLIISAAGHICISPLRMLEPEAWIQLTRRSSRPALTPDAQCGVTVGINIRF